MLKTGLFSRNKIVPLPDIEFITSFVTLLALVGACGGLLAGFLGVGGGLIVVPGFYYVLVALGIDSQSLMHIAVGTSLANIVLTSIVSTRAHHKRGAVDIGILKTLVPSIVVGSLFGSWVAGMLSGEIVMMLFGAIALLVAIYAGFAARPKPLRNALPGNPARSVIGTIIGSISAIIGIGGGAMSVPIMSLCGVPMLRAVGSSAAIGFFIAVPAVVGFAINGWSVADLPPFSLGYINWMALLIIAPLSLVMAPIGAKLAHKLPEVILRRVFAAYLLLVVVKMGTDLFLA